MNHRHRKVLHALFAHPVSANIHFRDVESVFKELGGEPVTEVRATVPTVRQFTERLANRHVPTFEADIDPAQRYLIDRGIKGGCRIHGQAQPDSAALAARARPRARTRTALCM